MAILRFRVYWEEDESVYRDVAVKHLHTFQDLHLIILKAYEFDSKHQATFYRSNDSWQEGREISLEKYNKSYKAEPLIMSETGIGTEIKDPHQKFIYVYDFEKGWRFNVELIQVDKEEDKSLAYPCLMLTEGLGPSQYGTKGMVDSRLAEMEEKYDLKPGAFVDGFGEEGEEEGGEEEDGTEDNVDQGEEF
jgi:hypothetical protein